MGFYNTWLFPRILDRVMQQKEMTPYRERIGRAAAGRVLEVGVGSGLNLALYGPRVRSVYGVDPSRELLQFAQKRARKASVPVELLQGSAEALPVENKSVDTVVTTFTLCTVADLTTALAEIRRVLAPGGVLLFAEHGRAPDAGVAWWQDRLTPLWCRIAGGCQLNRKPDSLLEFAGFRIDALETQYLPGPRVTSFVYAGRAHAS